MGGNFLVSRRAGSPNAGDHQVEATEPQHVVGGGTRNLKHALLGPLLRIPPHMPNKQRIDADDGER